MEFPLSIQRMHRLLVSWLGKVGAISSGVRCQVYTFILNFTLKSLTVVVACPTSVSMELKRTGDIDLQSPIVTSHFLIEFGVQVVAY